MVWAMLRSAAAAAAGRALRRGVSSSGASPTRPVGMGFRSRSLDHPPFNKPQVDALLEKIKDTRMNVAKGNLLIEAFEGLAEECKKKTVIGNFEDFLIVSAFCYVTFLVGYSTSSSDSRSEKKPAP